MGELTEQDAHYYMGTVNLTMYEHHTQDCFRRKTDYKLQIADCLIICVTSLNLVNLFTVLLTSSNNHE